MTWKYFTFPPAEDQNFSCSINTSLPKSNKSAATEDLTHFLIELFATGVD